MLETSDRLMLYQSEPSKPIRCCFGHSWHDPFPSGPMKNTFSIPALRKYEGHATGNRYDAQVIRDPDGRLQHGHASIHLALLLLLLLPLLLPLLLLPLLPLLRPCLLCHSFALVFVFCQLIFPSLPRGRMRTFRFWCLK